MYFKDALFIIYCHIIFLNHFSLRSYNCILILYVLYLIEYVLESHSFVHSLFICQHISILPEGTALVDRPGSNPKWAYHLVKEIITTKMDKYSKRDTERG